MVDESQLQEGNDVEKQQTKAFTLIVQEEDHFMDQIEHGNSFSRLQRIVAWMLRFLNRKAPRPSPWLTLDEMNESRKAILPRMQRTHFMDELKNLMVKIPIKRQSKLVGLDPFLDKDNILRVGGRLENSILHYAAKHPIIIPHEHQWTKLMLHEYHKDYLHAGAK